MILTRLRCKIGIYSLVLQTRIYEDMSCETLRRPSMSKRTVRMNKKGNADHQEILQRTRESSITKLSWNRQEILRGWVWGTSGNFSAVTSWAALGNPLVRDWHGVITHSHFLEIDGTPNVIRGDGRPSTETLVHLAIVRCVNAGAVLHTHSVWRTVLSCLYESSGGVILKNCLNLNA